MREECPNGQSQSTGGMTSFRSVRVDRAKAAVLCTCTFFGPKVSSSRGGTPLTSLRQRSRLALNMLLKGIGGTSMRPSLRWHRRTKVSNILHPWKKNFALAFGPRPLLNYAAEIPVEMSPEFGAATHPLSAAVSESIPGPSLLVLFS